MGKIGGSHDFQSKRINFRAIKKVKNLGKIGGSHDFQSKRINFRAKKKRAKNLSKYKIFSMTVYMIFKYSKRFQCAPSFNSKSKLEFELVDSK